MESDKFESLVEKAFSELPAVFRERVDNVQVVVEDYPSDEQIARMRLPSMYSLLGLYEGISLEKRGMWYGATATLPDRITLFQKNIERACRNENELEHKVREVLIHEIAHHFGMNEEEIRNAGY